MSKKVYDNAKHALEGVADNMTLLLGGFGLCGIPENSIVELNESVSLLVPKRSD